MRKYVILPEPVSISGGQLLRKLMLCSEKQGGTYLFLYNTAEDAGCFTDHWYPDWESAWEDLEDWGLGLEKLDWVEIPDPDRGCRQDLIRSVEVPASPHGRKK